MLVQLVPEARFSPLTLIRIVNSKKLMGCPAGEVSEIFCDGLRWPDGVFARHAEEVVAQQVSERQLAEFWSGIVRKQQRHRRVGQDVVQLTGVFEMRDQRLRIEDRLVSSPFCDVSEEFSGGLVENDVQMWHVEKLPFGCSKP
jgi:hypothetical protein